MKAQVDACPCEAVLPAPAPAQVPYSEHSSFAELQEFVGWLKPKQVAAKQGASSGSAPESKAWPAWGVERT